MRRPPGRGPLGGLALLLALPTAAAVLEPTAGQSATAALIASVSVEEHYRRASLEARPCAAILERFLNSLDPNRDVFMLQDIVGFGESQASLCEAFDGGELEPVFTVFGTFRGRLAERIGVAAGLLAGDWDFSVDEHFSPRGGDLPWAAGRGELDEIWRKRVKNDLLALQLSGRGRAEAVEILRQRYRQLEARADELGSNDVFRLFANAYIGGLDPHSEYFLPRRPQRDQRRGAALEGIGVQLATDREYIAIKRVFDGGAVDRSGLLHAGDRLVGVGQGADGELIDVVGWMLDPVVELLRGPIGTSVRLQILPRGAEAQDPADTVTLVRDRIDLRELPARMECSEVSEARICVIAVPQFYIDYAGYGRGEVDYAGTAADVVRLINEARMQRPVEGILLDLRGNPGGALLEAARLAGLFIDLGPVVQVRHAAGQLERFSDPLPGAIYAGPLAVLVDRYSASASEIVAAAIQDYGRGIIVGERTYGKGTVQETFDLNAPRHQTFGQLALTTAEYFRVTGESTQLSGVEPDLALPAWPGAGEYGERFESNPLPPGRLAAADFVRVTPAALVSNAVRERHLARRQKDPALHAVLTAAQARRVAGDRRILPLHDERRRRAREQLTAQQRELERALRAAMLARGDQEPAEKLWGDLVLREALRTLADVVAETGAATD